MKKFLTLGLLGLATALAPLSGGGRNASGTMASQAAVKTYHVRLVAYNLGTVVGSTEVTFQAADDLQFRNTVGDAQRLFSQRLNNQKVKWNRITFELLSVQ